MASYYIHKNHVVSLVKGDNLELRVKVGDSDLGTTDNIYFGLMFPNTEFNEAIIKKDKSEITVELDTEDNLYYATIPVNPIDTIELERATYYYSVKLYKDGKIITLIPNTQFHIVA